MGIRAQQKIYGRDQSWNNIINQEKRTYFHESDATGNADNDFSFLTYDETFTLKGYGLNFRGGLIYRQRIYTFRISGSLPTWMPLKRQRAQDLLQTLRICLVQGMVMTA